MEFLHQNHIDKYYVCRLSLTDLGLVSQYKVIRDKYGMDTDPSQNDSLYSDCEKIVNDFWDNKNIQDFENSRWLYNIKDMFINLTSQGNGHDPVVSAAPEEILRT